MIPVVFDYIVVGAGSAGCAVAARLSEQAGVSVLLLEAGGSGRTPKVEIPGLVFQAIASRRLNWHFRGSPDPSLGGRTLDWPAGRVLGGGSAINGMVFVRGLRSDFDRWEAAGNPGWGWETMLPYFQRLEHWHGAQTPGRGTAGPVPVVPVDEPNAACLAVMEGFVDRGTPQVADYNAGIDAGIGVTQANIYRGRRWSAARAYLTPARHRANLHIRPGRFVTRLLLKAGRCTGVAIAENGRERRIHCAREVILCAGAIGSPRLLMLSGVGDPAVLAGVGIVTQHALCGVGKGLNEHVNGFVAARVDVKTYNAALRGAGRVGAGLRWIATRAGPAASPANHVQGFVRSDGGTGPADAQIQTMPMSLALSGGDQGVSSVISLCRPEPSGSIGLSSADPRDPPTIRTDLLSTDREMRTMIAAMKLARDIYAGRAMRGLGTSLIGGVGRLNSDQAWREHLRAHCHTNWHPASSCRMGPDADAVVDAGLRVRGIDGLRIADASIMPSLTSGNTNAPCMLIGEVAAALIASGASDPSDRRCADFQRKDP